VAHLAVDRHHHRHAVAGDEIMSRAPSDKTALLTARREIKRLTGELNSAKAAWSGYRERATRAEMDASDWRKRFDLLLARTPKEFT
jgi:hypothetical protein